MNRKTLLGRSKVVKGGKAIEGAALVAPGCLRAPAAAVIRSLPFVLEAVLLGVLLFSGCAGPAQSPPVMKPQPEQPPPTETIPVAEEARTRPSPQLAKVIDTVSVHKDTAEISRAGPLATKSRGPDSVGSRTGSGAHVSDTGKDVPPAARQKKPEASMVCVADPGSAEGLGVRGEYILTGEVKCKYGKLDFETQRAVWNKRQNQVICDGGMKALVDDLILTAKRGGYKKQESLIWASGRVRGVDTLGKYEFISNYLAYYRKKHLMELTRRPILRKFYRDDSTAQKGPLKGRGKGKVDTLEIKAMTIMYNDSLRIAKAKNKVTITRGNLVLTCSAGVFYEEPQFIHLTGNPIAYLRNDTLKGDVMWLTLDGEELRKLTMKGQAQGNYSERAVDSLKKEFMKKYHLRGDSLLMEFKEETVQFIEIYKKGLATYFESKHPDKTNNMKGDYLRIGFVNDEIDTALVRGSAESMYYHFENGKYRGKNIAYGETLGISFQEGKIKDIRISGQARGTYFGESSGKKIQQKEPPEPEQKK